MICRFKPIYLLLACVLTVGFMQTGNAPALAQDGRFPDWSGSWAFALPDGNPAWLRLEPTADRWQGELLWSVGSPRPLDEVQSAEAQLTFRRELLWQPGGDSRETRRISAPFVAWLVGDQLHLRFQQSPVARPDDMETIELVGKRLPPLPPKPDLTQVQFGPPVSLFNGKDLEGWQLSNPRKKNGWSVKRGELVNETPKTDFGAYGEYGNLRTIRTFNDFQLTIEYSVPAGGNSGIYLRGMYEAQVVDRDSSMQGINGPGAIFGRIAPSRNAAKPGGEWNQYRLWLVQRHITVELNGERVIDNQPVAGCTGGGISADDTAPGPILLQGDHTSVRYRNIQVREVASSE